MPNICQQARKAALVPFEFRPIFSFVDIHSLITANLAVIMPAIRRISQRYLLAKPKGSNNQIEIQLDSIVFLFYCSPMKATRALFTNLPHLTPFSWQRITSMDSLPGQLWKFPQFPLFFSVFSIRNKHIISMLTAFFQDVSRSRKFYEVNFSKPAPMPLPESTPKSRVDGSERIEQ